jgi:hypothetical protein
MPKGAKTILVFNTPEEAALCSNSTIASEHAPQRNY